MFGDLLTAASRGRIDGLSRLLDLGADVNAKGEHGVTALMRAVESRNIKAVRVLIDAGAEVDDRGEMSWTAMTRAVLQVRGLKVMCAHGRLVARSRRFSVRPLGQARAALHNRHPR